MFLFLFIYFDNVFYILGLEDGSLDSCVFLWCDYVVYILMFFCMNLVVIVNVFFYDRLVKFNYEYGDGLICKSRDNNN